MVESAVSWYLVLFRNYGFRYGSHLNLFKKKKKLHISVVMEATLNIFESLRFISEDK